MTDLFKDIYNTEFYNKLAYFLSKTVSDFDQKRFTEQIFSDDFLNMELKQRMAHTAKVMHNFLSDDYKSAASSIIKLIATMKQEGEKERSIEYMFIPEYISMYGLEEVETSIATIEKVTQFTSCEFAIRPFIIKYPNRMLEQLLTWSQHNENTVRRLASEGSRPRLPWAMALPLFKKNPSALLPILDTLMKDPCEIVRRSVANNLNDISKDNPDVTIKVTHDWLGQTPQTDALLKHACRTLLKQSHPEVLTLFGFDSASFSLSNFNIITPIVVMGDELEFSFSVNQTSPHAKLLRLEYAVYYMKKNGQLSRKVFKISERMFKGNMCHDFVRKQSFKTITTRKHYQGLHQVSVILNGKEGDLLSFNVITKK